MIKNITHKGLKRFWESNDSSKLPPDQIKKIQRILSVLDTAKSMEPIRAIPGFKLHALKGELKGSWSVWVTGNYRICFHFFDGDVFDVNYSDYH